MDRQVDEAEKERRSVNIHMTRVSLYRQSEGLIDM